MKNTIKIFCLIGMLIDIIHMVLVFIFCKNQAYLIFTAILMAIRFTVCSLTYLSLNYKYKSYLLGLVNMISLSLVGGILYICWNEK